MKQALLVFHIIVAVSLIGLILLQTSKGGLGSAWGGGEWYTTRRGAEKMVFIATIVCAILFLATSIISLTVEL